MSRRNIILIVITVLAFGAAAFILYKGFFSKPAPPTNASLAVLPGPASVPAGGSSAPGIPAGPGGIAANPGSGGSAAPAAAAINRILPNGASLDFGPIKKYNRQQQLFNYPKVTPDEITVPIQQLIK